MHCIPNSWSSNLQDWPAICNRSKLIATDFVAVGPLFFSPILTLGNVPYASSFTLILATSSVSHQKNLPGKQKVRKGRRTT